MITHKQFKDIFPNSKNSEEIVKYLSELLPKYEINTPYRISAFLSQCGHESAGWRVFEENLNYSSKALNIVFPKYFKNAGRDSSEYHRQPEKIANIVYSSRMGNGSIESGEGWRYRGRGPIQLTGKNNYIAFKDDTGIDVIQDPDLISKDIKTSITSAIWFWNMNKLNKYADVQDIKGMTRKINGGYNGLEDRIHHYEKCLNMMNITETDIKDTKIDDLNLEVFGVIKRGSKGDSVKMIQNILGLKSDGIFGKVTEDNVKDWQSQNGLYPDGIVGPKTLEKMIG